MEKIVYSIGDILTDKEIMDIKEKNFLNPNSEGEYFQIPSTTNIKATFKKDRKGNWRYRGTCNSCECYPYWWQYDRDRLTTAEKMAIEKLHDIDVN